MTLAARFEEWAHQHKEEGLQEGRREGEARLLQRMLVARFGPLSQQTLAQLESASTAQIEVWSDRFVTAQTLADVFV